LGAPIDDRPAAGRLLARHHVLDDPQLRTVMSRTYIGIDPGLSGGIAWDSGNLPAGIPMPETDSDICEVITQLAIEGSHRNLTLVIEDVPKYVGTNIPGSSVFPLAFNCGLLRGVALALKIPIILVKPHDWQRHFRLGTKKDAGSTTIWKNKLKGEAQRRFPHLKVTLKTADSLLILAFARESLLG
jgi:hypothetical protein